MPRNARNEGYSRRHRFSTRGSFAPALHSSRKFRGRLAVIHTIAGTEGISRLGVALTRRLVPSAVQRNLVKRLVRETFRKHAARSAGIDCVVTLRERFDPARAGPMVAEVRELLDKICGGERR
jgi:ribonuclease P protein component